MGQTSKESPSFCCPTDVHALKRGWILQLGALFALLVVLLHNISQNRCIPCSFLGLFFVSPIAKQHSILRKVKANWKERRSNKVTTLFGQTRQSEKPDINFFRIFISKRFRVYSWLEEKVDFLETKLDKTFLDLALSCLGSLKQDQFQLLLNNSRQYKPRMGRETTLGIPTRFFSLFGN